MRDTPYFKVFRDVWGFMGVHYPVTDDPDYWGNLVDDAAAVYRKWAATEYGTFVKALLLDIVEELERNGRNEGQAEDMPALQSRAGGTVRMHRENKG